jgi:hypothetical protein
MPAASEGWYDPLTKERRSWPSPLEDYYKDVRVRDIQDGFQLYIDGNYAGDITKEKEASKGPDIVANYSRNFTEEFVDTVELDDTRSPTQKESALKAWLAKLKEHGNESGDD